MAKALQSEGTACTHAPRMTRAIAFGVEAVIHGEKVKVIVSLQDVLFNIRDLRGWGRDFCGKIHIT